MARAGPGCLNRISASISGASAGVKPPRGAEEDRSRLDPGCGRQGSNADGGHCTTKFENTHRIVRREVLYRLHPWFGRHVVVHEVVNKAAASSVFRCTLDGSEIERHLEIPAWMFDRATCAGDGHFALDPFVSLEALNALSILINQLLKTVVPSLTVQYSACGNSHEKNRGATSHDGKYEDSADRKASQDRHRRQADGSVR